MIKKNDIFRGIHTLVVILGIHGGGAATAKWLNLHGARVTVTDMRTKKELKRSLKLFSSQELKEISFVLGGQREEDFRSHDLIVVGPGVPRESPYLSAALLAGKRIENDASIFFRYVDSPVLAVTGTRGKTTTTYFLTQLLRKKYPKITPTGNNPLNPFFQELDRKRKKHEPVVAEMSSWQLEYLPISGNSPRIAAITNLYPDHLNRYDGIEDYARAKANIFFGQKKGDALILRHEDEWTPFYLKFKHEGKKYFVSSSPLPRGKDGIFMVNKGVVIRVGRTTNALVPIKRFAEKFGMHNVENLLFALLALFLYDKSIVVRESDILKLKSPPMRQEIIRKRDPMIINDSCATSPDGVIAAIQRFAKKDRIVLISGGTDKKLEFQDLADTISRYKENITLVLLEGSATDKLVEELKKRGVSYTPAMQTLYQCMNMAKRIAKTNDIKIIVFSPGGASFGKFLHEFDRGEKFNMLARKLWGAKK